MLQFKVTPVCGEKKKLIKWTYSSSHGNTAGSTSWVSMSCSTDFDGVTDNLIQVWGGVTNNNDDNNIC